MTVEAIPTQEDYITALSEQEIPAYNRMRADLGANHMGKWVVVQNAERAGISYHAVKDHIQHAVINHSQAYVDGAFLAGAVVV